MPRKEKSTRWEMASIVLLVISLVLLVVVVVVVVLRGPSIEHSSSTVMPGAILGKADVVGFEAVETRAGCGQRRGASPCWTI